MKIDRRLLDERPKNIPLFEEEEWALHGCHNNEEWHEYLSAMMWSAWMPRFDGKFNE